MLKTASCLALHTVLLPVWGLKVPGPTQITIFLKQIYSPGVCPLNLHGFFLLFFARILLASKPELSARGQSS
jgi:hypothetical protein